MCSWNISGLARNIERKDFIKHLINYDVFALYETWADCRAECLKQITQLLPEHDFYTLEGKKFNKHGRLSGGIVVGVKKLYAQGIIQIMQQCKVGVLLRLSKDFFGLMADVVLACCYLPPKDSVAYRDLHGDNRVEILQETLTDVLSQNVDENVHVIVAGDLNSRTGLRPDYIIDDDISYLPIQQYDVDSMQIPRKSKDVEVNSFGRTLVEMCCTLGIRMLNGRKNGDEEGEFTYMSSTGKSVNDYVLVSCDLFSHIEWFSVSNNDMSDHFPLEFLFNISHQSHAQNVTNEREELGENKRFRWNEKKKDYFIGRINDAVSAKCKQVFYDKCGSDIDEALEAIENMYAYAANNMKLKEKAHTKAKVSQPPWWDNECNDKKRYKYACLNDYRTSNRENDLAKYREAKNNF